MLSRVAIAAGCFVLSSVAQAQHYRVSVYLLRGRQTILLDFSPCIPAEGSGCGGFLVGTTMGGWVDGLPTAVKRVLAPDSTGGITIVGDSIALVRKPKPGEPPDQERIIFDPQRTPVATALAPDSRYAFVVFASKRSDVKAQVRMFDLSTRTGVASLLIDGVPDAIQVTR